MFDRGPTLFALRVHGQPTGAGSKTAQPLGQRGKEKRRHDGSLILIYRHQSDKTKPWMETVEKATMAAKARQQLETVDAAVWVSIECFEQRPESHFLADGRLRPDAPAHPHSTMTHDSGKLRRAIEDALTNVELWADDKRVVDGGDRKHYCDIDAVIFDGEDWREPRALIRVGLMLYQTVEEAEIKSPPRSARRRSHEALGPP